MVHPRQRDYLGPLVGILLGYARQNGSCATNSHFKTTFARYKGKIRYVWCLPALRSILLLRGSSSGRAGGLAVHADAYLVALEELLSDERADFALDLIGGQPIRTRQRLIVHGSRERVDESRYGIARLGGR